MGALTLPHVPPDHLSSLRILIERSPGLSPFVRGLQQLRLVIDASFLLGDLIWLVKKRKEPSARTAFKEVLASGTILAIAPVTLRQEVCEKIPLIAVRENIAEAQLREEWDSYQPFLHYVAEDDRRSSLAMGADSARDPNDLPYIYLYHSTDAAAVLSLDKDIAAMGAPTVGFDVIIHLRDYARSKTVEVSFLVCGATIGAASLQGAMELFAGLARGVAQLPDWAKLLLVIGGLVAVLHPGIRSAIRDFWVNACQQLKPLFDTVGPAVLQLVHALNIEKEKAIQSWNAANARLKPRKRITLKQYAVSACLEAGTPITIQEIEAKVRSYGYSSRAKSTMGYLTRVLRQDSRFIAFGDGRWAIVPA
ncbi:hypothetical protein [Nitrospira defluvii]|uniref:PIN domain-containing protein n=1 Tax=Nitrospira defluvii TaxID=330214 RepID=A0ABN7MAD3_9BACT|nr:hypothetical protein [Nitrospira defluvii]CAE6794145.1 hypothetical protein NSPZN2_70009 [Nitrospira defluvii]